MPIQIDEENGGKILIIHATGTLVKEDYPRLVSEFERLLKQHGKLRVLFDITGLHGWDAGAAWADIKFDLKHFADIERIAMVGDAKWHHVMAVIFKPFTLATVRYFDHGDGAGAREWLSELPAPSAPLEAGKSTLNHKPLTPEGILVIEPDAPLHAADFVALAREVDPYIAKHGKLPGLLIHAKSFPGWANLDAFLAHMRFVESHHKKLRKLAVVSDNNILAEVPKFASHIVDVQVRHFPESQYEGAMQWLKA